MSWEKLRLPVAIAALAALAFVWFTRDDGSRRGSAGGGDDRRGARGTAITAEDVPVLAWLHEDGASVEAERDRDLFEYAKSPEEIEAERLAAEARRREAEEARRRAAEEARRRAEEEARRRAAEAEKRRLATLRARQPEEPPPQRTEPPPPEPPTFTYEYVGIIGPHGDPHAILLADDPEDDDFHYAKAGDVIDGAFRVQRVGRLKMDLSYVDPTFAGDVTEVPRTFAAGSVDGAAPRGRSTPSPRNRTLQTRGRS